MHLVNQQTCTPLVLLSNTHASSSLQGSCHSTSSIRPKGEAGGSHKHKRGSRTDPSPSTTSGCPATGDCARTATFPVIAVSSCVAPLLHDAERLLGFSSAAPIPLLFFSTTSVAGRRRWPMLWFLRFPRCRVMTAAPVAVGCTASLADSCVSDCVLPSGKLVQIWMDGVALSGLAILSPKFRPTTCSTCFTQISAVLVLLPGHCTLQNGSCRALPGHKAGRVCSVSDSRDWTGLVTCRCCCGLRMLGPLLGLCPAATSSKL